MNQWQPIETAPKEHRVHTLLWVTSQSFPRVVVGHYDEHFRAWVSDGCGVIPTHWMPIPEGPTT